MCKGNLYKIYVFKTNCFSKECVRKSIDNPDDKKQTRIVNNETITIITRIEKSSSQQLFVSFRTDGIIFAKRE